MYGQDTIQKIDNMNLGDNHIVQDAVKQESEEKFEQTYNFGSTKTPSNALVGLLQDKWRLLLLSYFLKMRLLMW